MALWRAKDKPPVELVVANLEFEERIIKKGKNIVAAIIGKSYVGKSCAAILGEIVQQTQGQFNEGDINEWRSSYIKREY